MLDIKPVKMFHLFDGETRANHAASHRLGYLQKQRTGYFFWTTCLAPNIAFPTRKAALTYIREFAAHLNRMDISA